MEQSYISESISTLSMEERLRIELSKIENLAPLYEGGFYLEQVISNEFRSRWSEYNQFDNIAIVRVGSGARLDGSGYGDNELVYLAGKERSEDSVKEEHLLATAVWLNRPVPFYIGKRFGEGIIQAPLIELKHLEKDKVLSRHTGSFTKEDFTSEMLLSSVLPELSTNSGYYPERVLDAEFIAGNEEVWIRAKLSVLKEICENNKILRDLRDRRNAILKVCNTGVQRYRGVDLRQFDPDTGTFFYDPENKINGMKYSFLRLVQLHLNIQIYNYIKIANIDPADVTNIPSSIEEKLIYIDNKGWPHDREALVSIMVGYAKSSEPEY